MSRGKRDEGNEKIKVNIMKGKEQRKRKSNKGKREKAKHYTTLYYTTIKHNLTLKSG